MEGRNRYSFDRNWRFALGDPDGAQAAAFDDGGWRTVHAPHDWSVEGAFDEHAPSGGDGGYLPGGVGWYRKTFVAEEAWRDRKVTVQFDGVYMNSDVWVNGTHLGRYPFGYGSFEYELTPHLVFGGTNVVAVRVDNGAQPNSRWYSGSGITRRVWLQATDRLHIDRYGVFVATPDVSPDGATVAVGTRVVNDGDLAAEAIALRAEVLDARGAAVACAEAALATIEAGAALEARQELRLERPALWSVEAPQLYTLRTTLIRGGVTIDAEETTFGVRSAAFDRDRGFLLNDRQVKINGVCLHHDGGCVGAAVPERVWERRLELLKEMGVNGIRMSHNPPDPELLDLCDRMGFLVMGEAFDEWTITKWKNGRADVHGYAEYFDAWAERDLTTMLRRDRNHPSVVIWSIGNEIPEQREPNGHDVARRLIDVCRREDPTRLVTAACDNIEAEPVPATEAFLETLDVVGYNYVGRWRTRTETFYSEDRHRYPHRRVIGTENPGIVSVRGDYSLEPPTDQWWRGPYPTAMIGVEQLWKYTRMHDFVAGDFMWTGIDYIGETRWPNKNASFGVIDTCGFPKDGYYFYQSQWTDRPMAHLFPHWNWTGQEGRVIPVLCYTNCESAELFVNGKSFGMKSYEFPRQGMTKEWAHFERPYVHVTTSDLHLTWDVPYEPGTLRLVGYRGGAIVVETEVATTGEPAAIRVEADRATIAADGRDVCHVTVRVVDEAGRTVPTADVQLAFRVEGAGALIGTDNGKPDCHESYKSNRRRTFNGLALAIVQSTLEAGDIRVMVEAEDLGAADLVVKTFDARTPGR
ncbi:glycoside hydrolase family 2 TIM barrel-domain containing protein [Paenibacillus sp.]|uniref:glycoside hydrolase family 2 TIM barrel-domain containing protein n=1 Tax=Paenibacillus sp. TaxID=58172 RepID=UPI002811DEDC|nr:glycoside hydrolase family 2 TIM barrel-domain containing protein [Paenibacillus sp.]